MSGFLINPYRFSDPVTAEFVALHTAVGSTLTGDTINAVDVLVKIGRADGWWDRLAEAYPYVGSVLAGALIKLKTAPGLPTSLTNVGLVAGEYSQALGIGPSSVTTKHLTTGLIPADHGITVNNMSIGGSLIHVNASSSGWAFSSQSTSGESIGTVNNNGANAGHFGASSQRVNTNLRHTLPRLLQASYGDGATYPRYVEHMMGCRLWSSNASFTLTGGGFSTEMMFFRSRRFGTSTFYNADRIGFHFIGQALTDAQADSLNRAILNFERAVGRTAYQGNIIGIVGDSIGSGQNATTLGGTWAGRLQTARGGLIANSSRPAQSFTVLAPGAASHAALGLPKWVIAIGTNDINVDPVANGDPVRIANYKATMISFLQTLVSGGTAAANILVTSPHYIRPAQASLTKCRAYATAVSEAAAAVGCPFADIDQHFRNGGGDAWMSDNTHPNDTGHEQDFNVINAALP